MDYGGHPIDQMAPWKPQVRLVLTGGWVAHLRAICARLCFAYLALNPHPIGKGFVRRRVLPAVAPHWPSSVRVTLSHGLELDFGWGDVIGSSFAASGSFEPAELAAVARFAAPGTCVIDVGANVGLITLVAAASVGPAGSVVAVEPLPANVARLAENVHRNGFEWVQIEPVAAGFETETAILHVTRDPAYPSLKTPTDKHRVIDSLAVLVRSVDDIWRARGSPSVSMLKVDVEGGELEVLRGAVSLLATCRPVILAESHREHIGAVAALLDAHGYSRDTPPDFRPGNHLWLMGHHQAGGLMNGDNRDRRPIVDADSMTVAAKSGVMATLRPKTWARQRFSRQRIGSATRGTFLASNLKGRMAGSVGALFELPDPSWAAKQDHRRRVQCR